MILQTLNRYYDRLVEAGTLERPGWQPVKISFALQIDDDGTLKRVLRLGSEADNGKKKKWTPLADDVPAQEKRTVGIASNFLCDNSSYLLGIDGKGKPERSLKCFQACKALHETLLRGVDSGMDDNARNSDFGFGGRHGRFDNSAPSQPRNQSQAPAAPETQSTDDI